MVDDHAGHDGMVSAKQTIRPGLDLIKQTNQRQGDQVWEESLMRRDSHIAIHRLIQTDSWHDGRRTCNEIAVPASEGIHIETVPALMSAGSKSEAGLKINPSASPVPAQSDWSGVRGALDTKTGVVILHA